MTHFKVMFDEDIECLWLEEAALRDAELDSGAASMRDAQDVFRDARALIVRRLSAALAFASNVESHCWRRSVP